MGVDLQRAASQSGFMNLQTDKPELSTAEEANVKNMEDFSLFNEIYSQYFKDHKPARSCFAVAQLPKDALVEIEVIATR